VDEQVASSRQVLANRQELLTAAAVLLLATMLRIAWPALSEFKFSEARLEALALELVREGHLPLVGVPSSAGFDHSPISVYLYVPAFLLTSNPIPATVYGGLVSAGAVALCWWLARRWPGGDPWAALIAALLFAASPWAVAFSRKIWQVVFVPALTLTFVGLAVSALVAKRRWNLAWALLAFAVLVQVHPSAVSLTPALVLWLIVFWRQVRLGPFLVGTGLGALTAVPFLAHQVQSGWPIVAALKALPSPRWDLSAVQLAWEAITGRGIHALAGEAYPLLKGVPQIERAFSLVGWLVVGAGVWLAWRAMAGWRARDTECRRVAQVDLMLLSWLVIPVAFNLRHSLDLYLHFFVVVMPAAYLIVGRAATSILSSFRSKARRHTGRYLGLAGVGLLALGQTASLALLAEFVATHDAVGGFGTPLSKYLDIAGQIVSSAAEKGAVEVLVVGQGDSTVVDETPAIFDVLLRDRVAYRFVDGESAAVFPPHTTAVLLAPSAGRAAGWYQPWPAVDAFHTQTGYRLVLLDGSWPEERFEPIGGPRTFENGVELQGYSWGPEVAETQRVRFWLLWQVLWLNDEDTHFSVRALSPEGQLWGQRDAVGYPASYRRRGDRIVSMFDIITTESAPSELSDAEIGVYNFPQLSAVPVIDGVGNPVDDRVRIGP
jgi:hypothetical protein